MAALPIFTKTGATGSPLTIPKGRFLPVSEPIRPNQIVGVAGGGQVKVADLGSIETTFPFVINRVTAAERTALLAFFAHANVNYRQNSFTFTDEDSVNHTVRLWSEVLDFPHIRGNLYNLRFTLREEITS